MKYPIEVFDAYKELVKYVMPYSVVGKGVTPEILKILNGLLMKEPPKKQDLKTWFCRDQNQKPKKPKCAHVNKHIPADKIYCKNNIKKYV